MPKAIDILRTSVDTLKTRTEWTPFWITDLNSFILLNTSYQWFKVFKKCCLKCSENVFTWRWLLALSVYQTRTDIFESLLLSKSWIPVDTCKSRILYFPNAPADVIASALGSQQVQWWLQIRHVFFRISLATIEVMPFLADGTKPSPEPMLTSYQ